MTDWCFERVNSSLREEFTVQRVSYSAGGSWLAWAKLESDRMIWVPNKFFLSKRQTDEPEPKIRWFLYEGRASNRMARCITSPGTNINEALLRAIFILNEADNLGMLDPNSVSLIILVSDGDPTVGKYHFSFLATDTLTVIFGECDLLTMGNLMAFAWVSKPC